MSDRIEDPRLTELKNKGIELYSISKLNTINGCLHEAYRTYKLHERGTQNIYSFCGTRLHDVLENMANNLATRDDLRPAIESELEDMDTLGIDFPKNDDGSSPIRDGWLKNIYHFCDTFEMPKDAWKTEELFIYKTDDGHYIQGYIDLSRIIKDGTLEIYDHKSSSMYTAQGIEEHSKQLLTYLLGKEQEGYKVSKIAWHFMKYVDVQFMGKKTIKSKEKTLLTKTIERRKIGSEMAKYIESDLIDAGIDEVECDILLNEFIETNKFDCLPDNIRSKYVMKPCIVEYEITEEAKEDCKKYITDTIKKWESLDGKDEKNFPPRSFTRMKKNGETVRDDFYCNNLCGHKRTCPYYQDYIATLDVNEDDYNIF